MPTVNPTDVARLGHRFIPFVKHLTAAREIVAHRAQRAEGSIRQQTEVYYELGSVDPTGEASESPEFRFVIEEYVHDVSLDLVLAGKAAIATAWNAVDYINDSKLNLSLLERNNAGVVRGETQYLNGVLSEAAWRWQMGQPIMGNYTVDCKLGKRWTPGNEPHASWGAADTTTPGGIRVKDSRLFLGGTGDTSRIYRLQGFSLRIQFPATPIREVGNRALVGWIVEQPRTTLDIDLLVADHQPDDILYANVGGPATYYDYVNPQPLANSVIRIYDPDDTEAATVLRSWKLENLKPTNATTVLAQVRGAATKRYSFVLNKATTAGTGGVLMYNGDLP